LLLLFLFVCLLDAAAAVVTDSIGAGLGAGACQQLQGKPTSIACKALQTF
jgi:hypothetical protein